MYIGILGICHRTEKGFSVERLLSVFSRQFSVVSRQASVASSIPSVVGSVGWSFMTPYRFAAEREKRITRQKHARIAATVHALNTAAAQIGWTGLTRALLNAFVGKEDASQASRMPNSHSVRITMLSRSEMQPSQPDVAFSGRFSLRIPCAIMVSTQTATQATATYR